jgi:hypothetical protein
MWAIHVCVFVCVCVCVCVCVVEFYSTIKKNEIMWFEGKWMWLEDIMLIEVSQAQKDKVHMFSFIYGR